MEDSPRAHGDFQPLSKPILVQTRTSFTTKQKFLKKKNLKKYLKICLKGLTLVKRKTGNWVGFFFCHSTVLGNSILLCHMHTSLCLAEELQELSKGNGKITHPVQVG